MHTMNSEISRETAW